jgi:hypothetical protein
MFVQAIKKNNLLRAIQIAAISLVTFLLVATIGFLILESTWVKTEARNQQDSFLYGMTGTEVMPLPVLQILPDLFPDQFQPVGKEAGDWVQQFGFIAVKPAVNEGLPLGFSISNYRPKSGSPSPVKFVGFSCALCHTSQIKTSDLEDGVLVYGMGSTSLNFISWVDAVRTAFLDEKRLTPAAIAQTYEAKYHKSLRIMEKLMIRLWLSNTRKTLKAALPKVDAPYSGKELINADLMSNGPSRTQPFRNLVRSVMNRPAATDKGYSKFPVLYEQKNHEWGQFDGSVRNRLTRSVLAAIATGATVDNLEIPEISSSVVKAVDYTVNLKGPKYAEVFKNKGAILDPTKVERGRSVYLQHCNICHGYRSQEDDSWIKGQLQGEVVPVQQIKTDSERVNFRYYDVLVDYLYDSFPKNRPLKKHPLQPKREGLRPGPLGTTRGYLNTPLESVFSHAPYIHNGSVPTLAELINLKPRRDIFYRGDNLYDPVDVGLVVLDQPDEKRYFKFDTHRKGNSNKGHDYPWSYRGEGWDKNALEDLLEFLKTL